MTTAHAELFAAAFTAKTLETALPIVMVGDEHDLTQLACSLRCAAYLLDDSQAKYGANLVAIELADPFKTHDKYCAHCGRRVS